MPTLEEIQISVDNLDPNSNSIDYVLYATQATTETSCISFCSIKTVDMLPDLIDNEIPNGHIIFVEEIGGPVFATNKTWMSLRNKTVIRKDGAIKSGYTWGNNNCGQLGLLAAGGSTSSPTSMISDITYASITNQGSGVLTSSGQVYMWGQNDRAQLGIGYDSAACCFTGRPTAICGTNSDWCDLVVGAYNTFAIKTDGTLWGWGEQTSWKLGPTNPSRQCCPLQYPIGCDWRTVRDGLSHVLAIKTDGTLWVWGNNNCYQLGIGNICCCSSPTTTCAGGLWTRITASECSSAGIRTDGTLWTWGYGYYGKLGTGSNTQSVPTQISGGGSNWCDVSFGYYHGVGVKTDGTLWAWGYNQFGTVGNGNTTQVNSPIQTCGGGTNWCAISTGYWNSYGIKTDGTMWGWGYGGQTGDGTSISRCSPVSVAIQGNPWIRIAKADGYNSHMLGIGVT